MKRHSDYLRIIWVLGLMVLGAGPCVASDETDVGSTSGWNRNVEAWVDQRHELGHVPGDSGELEGAFWHNGRLSLSDEAAARFPARGQWVSPEVETDLPFVELLPSWNVAAPAKTGLALEVRVRNADDGTWSPWMRIGEWGKVEGWRKGVTLFEHGTVEIDVLRLKRPADAFRVRVTLQSHAAEAGRTPTLRKLVVVTSGQDAERAEAQAQQLDTQALTPSDWARDLPVPFFTQQSNPPALRPRTCSPTSTSMAAAYRGVDRPITETALSIYDPEYAIFGNWGRAVAWASQQGLDAELSRLRDWRQVKQLIAAGQPIIASIRFESGTFPSNVMDSTNGHLIVIRGLTADGDAIVNDPASADRGNGVIYKKEELAAAWFAHGGVCYLIGEPVSNRDSSEENGVDGSGVFEE